MKNEIKFNTLTILTCIFAIITVYVLIHTERIVIGICLVLIIAILSVYSIWFLNNNIK